MTRSATSFIELKMIEAKLVAELESKLAAVPQVADFPPPRTAATNARYIASPIEAHWLASPKVGKICQTSQTQTPKMPSGPITLKKCSTQYPSPMYQ